MATLNKTFPFATTLEGFTGVPFGTSMTMSYDGTYGNPSGSLKSRNVGRNKAGTSYWEWTGTWEDLGITPGTTIDQVRINNGDNQCTEWNVGDAATIGPYSIYNSAGDVLIATLWAGRSPTGVEGSWTSIGNQAYQAIGASYQASNTSIRIRLYNTSDLGNNPAAAQTFYDDNISLDIDYVAGSDDLTAVGITANPVVGTPAIGQEHVLTAAGITANPVVGIPVLLLIFILTSVGILATPVLGTPTITHIHVLTATGITADPVVGTPTLSSGSANSPVREQNKDHWFSGDLPDTVAFDEAVTEGSLLVVCFSGYLNSSTNAITISDDKGNTWQAAEEGYSNGSSMAGIWYAKNAAAGVTTLTINDTEDQTCFLLVVLIEYSNVNTTAPIDQSNEAIANSASWDSGDVTTTQADTVLIGVMGQDSATRTLTEDSPWVLIFKEEDQGSYTPISVSEIIATSTLTDAYTGEMDGIAMWYSAVVAFKAASATDDLVAVGITANPVVGTPTLTRISNLTATAITADPVLGVPTAAEEGGSPAGVKVATTRVACKTTTGLQTITTTDLGGLTPTAALLICTNATADGTAADHARMSIGAVVSATERWAISSNDDHGVATALSVRRMTEDEVVMMVASGGGGTVEFEADFDSWVTNGMVIDWGSTNPSSGYLLTVIFFAGSDVVAHADTVSLPATTGVNTDVTAPGFEPAFVIFASTRSAINDEVNTNFALSFGIAANDGADTNFSLNLSGANSALTSENAVLAINDSIQENLFQGNVYGGHYVDTYDADGFTVRCIRNGGGDSPYLAIGFGGAVDVWLGDISTPISTGDDVETGPGFTPQALIGGLNYSSSGFQGGATPSNDVESIYSAGIGIATPTAEYSNVVTSEDAADTMNTQSLSDDVFANVQPHIGGTAQDIVGTGPAGAGSFDASGFTLNYSAVDVVDNHPFFVLAIEAESDGDNDLTAVSITANPVLDTPSIGQKHLLTATGITANPVLGTPTIGRISNLNPVDITANPVLGTPTITHIHVLTATGIIVNPTLGTPVLGAEGEDSLEAVSIVVNPALGTPALAQEHALGAVGITADPVVGTPSIERISNLTATGITADPVVGTPTIGRIPNLDAVDIVASPVLSVPTVSRVSNLIAVGITANPVLDTPSIGQTHVLDAVDIISTPVLGTPVLGSEGEHTLEAVGITSDTVVGTPAIGQTHVVSSVGISTTPVTETPTIALVHILNATSITATPVVEESAIGQTHALSPTDITTTPVVGAPILSPICHLDATDITTTPTVETPTIGQTHVLDATTIIVSPIFGVPTIGQTHVLSAEGITTTPELGVASWELVDGEVIVTFSAFPSPMLFTVLQPEIEFSKVYTED